MRRSHGKQGPQPAHHEREPYETGADPQVYDAGRRPFVHHVERQGLAFPLDGKRQRLADPGRQRAGPA